MRRIFLSISVFIFSATIIGCATVQNKPNLNSIPKPVSFSPAHPERWVLQNGLTVLFVKDSEIPLVRGMLYLKGGGLFEPPGHRGIVSAMGGQLRQGGAGSLGPDQLDLALEKLSASIESSYAGEFGTVGFGCLSSDFNEVFGLFSDVILRPRFDESRLSLYKSQNLDLIRRRADDPDTVAGIGFGELLYGDDSPYGRVLGSKDLLAINRADLIRAHNQFVRPDGAILAITGDISRDELSKAIEKRFGAWKKRGSTFGPLPPVNAEPKPGIYFVKMPFAQSTIYMGELGVPRLTPDYAAIDGFNVLFGAGGFGSMLNEKVRTELGLAYVVYGSILAGPVKGKNFIAVQTKAETTGRSIKESISVLTDIQDGVVKPETFEEAKRSLENSFVFRFDSPDNLIQRRAQMELLGYPMEYDDTYIDKISNLTPSDAVDVAKRRWHPNKFSVIVVGNETALNSVKSLLNEEEGPLKDFQLKELTFSEKLEMPK